MKYVAYYRVSTKQQGKSGLGLEAQKTLVNQFLKAGDEIVTEFIEVDSGGNSSRVQISKAIEYCKSNDATLLIAKLDRLARNVSFIFNLRDSNVKFVCCDIPDANTLNIGIFATMAQYEKELISARTKAALAAKKAQGFKLGTNNLTDEGRAKGSAALTAKAANNENNRRATMLVCEYKKQGMTLEAIANKLNDNGFKSSTGKLFQKTTVSRLYKRYCQPA